MLSSAVAIWVIVLARGQARGVLDGLKNRKALGRLGAATLFGPVLGMICYVSAFKTAPAGIVSLLSSLSPVLIIPISAWRYKTKINTAAFICVALALAGVLLVTL
jgi:drug/metabolite transporter (DMT)-like permease